MGEREEWVRGDREGWVKKEFELEGDRQTTMNNVTFIGIN